MAERLEYGDPVEGKNGDRYPLFIEVSSSLMNRITAESMSDSNDYTTPKEVLGAVVSGEYSLSSEGTDDTDE